MTFNGPIRLSEALSLGQTEAVLCSLMSDLLDSESEGLQAVVAKLLNCTPAEQRHLLKCICDASPGTCETAVDLPPTALKLERVTRLLSRRELVDRLEEAAPGHGLTPRTLGMLEAGREVKGQDAVEQYFRRSLDELLSRPAA
jgi:hypothetical protein